MFSTSMEKEFLVRFRSLCGLIALSLLVGLMTPVTAVADDPTVVLVGWETGAGSSSSFTAWGVSTPVAGDLLVIGIAGGRAVTIDASESGWVKAQGNEDTDTTQLWYKIAAGDSSDDAVTFNMSGTDQYAWAFAEYSSTTGWGTDPLDASAFEPNSGYTEDTYLDSGTTAPPSAAGLGVAMFRLRDGNAATGVSLTNGYGLVDSAGTQLGQAWSLEGILAANTAATTSAQSSTLTWSNGTRDGRTGVIAVFVPASAQPSLVADPGSLPLTGVVDGTPVDDTVTVTASDGATGVAVDAVVDDGGQGWLTVTPQGSTPAVLTVGADPAGLTAGTYTGTVTATAAGYEPVTIDVTYTIQSDIAVEGSSTGAGSSSSFTASAPAAPVAGDLLVVGIAGGRAVTIDGSESGWFKAQGNEDTDTTQLWYKIAAGDASDDDVTFNMSGADQYVWVYSEYSAVSGWGTDPLDVTAYQPESGWTDGVDVSSGTTAVPSSNGLGVAMFKIQAGAALADGLAFTNNYVLVDRDGTEFPNAWSNEGIMAANVATTATVQETTASWTDGDRNQRSGVIAVFLPANPQPALVADSSSLPLAGVVDGASVDDTVTVSASDEATGITVDAVADDGGQGWLTVTPAQATTPATFTVTANPTGLTAGTYTGTITTTATGYTPIDIVVTYTIEPDTAGIAQIQLTDGSSNYTTDVSASFPAAPTQGNHLIAVVTSGAATIDTPAGWTPVVTDFTTDSSTGIYWKPADPADIDITFTFGGASEEHSLVLFEYAGLANPPTDQSGTYQDPTGTNSSLTVTADSANSQAIELNIAGVLGWNFDTDIIWDSSYTEAVDQHNGGYMNYGAATKITTATETATATATVGDTMELYGIIATFLPASAEPEPSLVADSGSLSLSGLVDGAAVDDTVTVTTSAGVAGVTVDAVADDGGQGWLTITPSHTTTPAVFIVTANPTGLTAGTYNGTITTTGTGYQPAIIDVTLEVSFVAPWLAVSSSSDRSQPLPLDGAIVSGPAFVFVDGTATGIESALFWFDDPTMAGAAYSSDAEAPFDFGGGTTTTASPWNSAAVADGTHTMTVRLDFIDASSETLTSSFTTDNGTADPATVSLIHPTDGLTVFGLQPVQVTVDPSTAVGTVDFSVDGSEIGQAPIVGGEAGVDWDTTQIADGTHVLTVTVKDTAGTSVNTDTATVTVDNESETVERIEADYAAGVLSVDEFVETGVVALTLPELLPPQYQGTQDGADDEVSLSEWAVFLEHWEETSLDSQDRAADYLENYIYLDDIAAAESIGLVSSQLAPPVAPVDTGFWADDCEFREGWFDGELRPYEYVCTHESDHFITKYTVWSWTDPEDMVALSDHELRDGTRTYTDSSPGKSCPLKDATYPDRCNGIPDYIDRMVASAEHAWAGYQQLGFPMPSFGEVVISVREGRPKVIPIPFRNPLSIGVEPTGDDYSTVQHELFHVVQIKNYMSSWDYVWRDGFRMWSEATAEWAQHQVLRDIDPSDPNDTDPDDVHDDYAAHIDDYLQDTHLSVFRWNDDCPPSPDVCQPQYGGFIFAEFLEERFEDTTDGRNGDFIKDVFAIDEADIPSAIETLLGSGSAVAEMLVDFHVSSYVLDSETAPPTTEDIAAAGFTRDLGGEVFGFEDPALVSTDSDFANDITTWRERLNRLNGPTSADAVGGARPERESHDFSTDGLTYTPDVTGRWLEDSGVLYYDFVTENVGPGDVVFETRGAGDLQFTVLAFDGYPHFCDGYPPRVIDSGDGTESKTATLEITSDCDLVTLVVSDTRLPNGLDILDVFDLSVSFVPFAPTDAALTVAVPTDVVAGSSFDLAWEVENLGTDTAVRPAITALVPDGIVSATGTDCQVDVDPTDPTKSYLTCSLADIAAGTTANTVVQLDVDPTSTGAMLFDAMLTTDSPDPIASNNSAAATVTVSSETDFGVTGTYNPDPPRISTQLNWTLTVTNHGPSTGSATVVVDPPAEFVDLVIPPSCTGTPPVPIECSIGDVEPGQAVDLLFSGRLDDTLNANDQVDFVASVTPDSTDPVLGNNAWVDTVEVAAPYSTTVVLNDPPVAVLADGDHYTPESFDVVATVTNDTAVTLTDVSASIQLGDGLYLIDSPGTHGLGDLPPIPSMPHVATWTVGIEPQEHDATLTYTVTVSGTPNLVHPNTHQESLDVPGLAISGVSPTGLFVVDANNRILRYDSDPAADDWTDISPSEDIGNVQSVMVAGDALYVTTTRPATASSSMQAEVWRWDWINFWTKVFASSSGEDGSIGGVSVHRLGTQLYAVVGKVAGPGQGSNTTEVWAVNDLAATLVASTGNDHLLEDKATTTSVSGQEQIVFSDGASWWVFDATNFLVPGFGPASLVSDYATGPSEVLASVPGGPVVSSGDAHTWAAGPQQPVGDDGAGLGLVGDLLYAATTTPGPSPLSHLSVRDAGVFQSIFTGNEDFLIVDMEGGDDAVYMAIDHDTLGALLVASSGTDSLPILSDGVDFGGEIRDMALATDPGPGAPWTGFAIIPGGGGRSSRSWGDPHLITGDGLKYEFQKVGELIAAETDDGAVVVQVRQAPWGSSDVVAVNTALAADVGGDRVGFYVGGSDPVLLDGVPVALATGESVTLPGGGLVQRTGGSTYQVYWPGDAGTPTRLDVELRSLTTLIDSPQTCSLNFPTS